VKEYAPTPSVEGVPTENTRAPNKRRNTIIKKQFKTQVFGNEVYDWKKLSGEKKENGKSEAKK